MNDVDALILPAKFIKYLKENPPANNFGNYIVVKTAKKIARELKKKSTTHCLENRA